MCYFYADFFNIWLVIVCLGCVVLKIVECAKEKINLVEKRQGEG